MGSRYMIICWFGVDVIVEFGVWCNLCEKPNIGSFEELL
jgi:hypothetical protein